MQQRQRLDKHDCAEASMQCSKTGAAKVAGDGRFVQTVGSIIALMANVVRAQLPRVMSANMQQTPLQASAMGHCVPILGFQRDSISSVINQAVGRYTTVGKWLMEAFSCNVAKHSGIAICAIGAGN